MPVEFKRPRVPESDRIRIWLSGRAVEAGMARGKPQDIVDLEELLKKVPSLERRNLATKLCMDFEMRGLVDSPVDFTLARVNVLNGIHFTPDELAELGRGKIERWVEDMQAHTKKLPPEMGRRITFYDQFRRKAAKPDQEVDVPVKIIDPKVELARNFIKGLVSEIQHGEKNYAGLAEACGLRAFALTARLSNGKTLRPEELERFLESIPEERRAVIQEAYDALPQPARTFRKPYKPRQNLNL